MFPDRELWYGCSVHRYLCVLTALFFVACGDDDSTDDIPDLGFVDTGTGDGGLPPATLFGACANDAQCQAGLGPDAVCRPSTDGFTGGSCSIVCTDRTPCDDGVVNNFCLDFDGDGVSHCEPACQNSTDCRESYLCTGRGDLNPAEESIGVCTGFCSSDEACGAGAECSEYAATCVAEGTVPTEGGLTGESCTENDDCISGWCLPETGPDGAATGWTGGTCLVRCELAPGWNTNDLYFESSFPTTGCEGDAVCFPNGDYTQRSEGVCLTECATDADCRSAEGYFCRRTYDLTGGARTFDNGVCFPME